MFSIFKDKIVKFIFKRTSERKGKFSLSLITLNNQSIVLITIHSSEILRGYTCLTKHRQETCRHNWHLIKNDSRHAIYQYKHYAVILSNLNNNSITANFFLSVSLFFAILHTRGSRDECLVGH